MQFFKNFNTKYGVIAVLGLLLLFYWNALPDQLFKDPTSTVLNDEHGNLLGARIARDGQWRFPYNDKIPERFEACILEFEDRDFYNHFGISFKAIVRAISQNYKAGKIVSGASTVSMQVIRLSRKGKSRTYFEKVIEAVWTTRLEFSYSKEEILALYASNAPFGGNVVGLDAASWRYFGRPAHKLSWAESATLAVLPNAPGLIFPGRNQQKLKEKRNRLLKRLNEQGKIDALSLKLALLEPLPGKPYKIPIKGLHLLNRAAKEGYEGKKVSSTIDRYLQNGVDEVVRRHHQHLIKNNIFNACALVVNIETGEVKSYLGNTDNQEREHGSRNDVIMAPRSTGSILKPFLYAQMLTDGEITPDQLIADIPTQVGGFAPKNFDLEYDGAVPASRALARSLNIPAVRMLKEYGMEKFHYNMKKMGLTTLSQPAGHYGLSMILGGAEGKLWDIVNIYRKMALKLDKYPEDPRLNKIHYTVDSDSNQENMLLNAGAIWHTFEAMKEVVRPENEMNWEYFSGGQNVAWKTGTSFGFRDAWAVGITSDYVIGVWVGNADGEGRPGLTGIKAAAPILFDVIDLLPKERWFDPPYDEMEQMKICKHSGYRASPYCFDTVSDWVIQKAGKTRACKYCRNISLDQLGKYRVNSNCESVNNMQIQPWFVLTPLMEWFYKKKHSEYKELPPFRADCNENEVEFPIRIIYPKILSQIYLPVGFKGKPSKVVFEASHRHKKAIIHWHLDKEYLGSTTDIHQMELRPSIGEHILTLTDNNGQVYSQKIKILDKE